MPSAELRVRLQPRASRESIGPERAGVARGRVAVIRGERARDKVVRVEGIDLPSLREALGLDRYSARE